ncbi:DUF4124 domain-containing protein [Pseudomonas oryzihabitans]|uniref:DUF4124 domain-containing protein n=1 Tax=Pseudomonas oryzihabitans TaxID=47885 RepID=UPI001D690682|nr:DUF4124 domain-containing protein [Pseudomonas oryzihabitans]HJE67588.1 DUF4124 domain-containing protein [Pseudomonas oryzihabitans]
MRAVLIAVALLLAAGESQAANVFKCVDAKGKITFTAHANCPDNHALDDVVVARNPTISSAGEETVMAERRSYRAQGQAYYGAPPAAASGGVTVVGASRIRPDCDTGLNDQDLRTAKVRKEIMPGMTRSQVASIQNDDPRRARGGAGTDTKWSHDYKSSTSVSYDRNGCAGRIDTWQRK